MHLSCAISSAWAASPEVTIGQVRTAGFEGIEFSLVGPEMALPHASERLEGLQQLLVRHHLTVSSANVSPMSATGNAEIPAALATIEAELAYADALGLSEVNIQAGDRRLQSMETFLAGLRGLLELAETFEMDLMLANRFGSRVEDLEDLRHILLELDHPRLGLAIDTAHFHMAAVNPRDALREFGDRMGLLRIADRVGRRPVPLGQGESNIKAIIEHARRLGYEDWLVVDVEPAGQDTLITRLEQAASYLRSLLE